MNNGGYYGNNGTYNNGYVSAAGANQRHPHRRHRPR